jgi:MtN3 and saliva related transmembrane protein
MVVSIDIVGWVALVLTQVFWIPNITRIVRTRDVAGYSLVAWIIMVAGLSCWLVYFAVQGDVVGVVANIFGVTGAGVTTLMIWMWKRPAQPEVVLAGSLTVDQG